MMQVMNNLGAVSSITFMSTGARGVVGSPGMELKMSTQQNQRYCQQKGIPFVLPGTNQPMVYMDTTVPWDPVRLQPYSSLQQQQQPLLDMVNISRDFVQI